MSADAAFPAVDETRLAALAAQLAPRLRGGGVLYLQGDLGAGKTTFARALLRALGVGARVKSPTYSLVESYALDGLEVHHLDLYRIADPGELEWLGLADLTAEPYLLVIELAHAGAARDVRFVARSERGRLWLRNAPGGEDKPGKLQ